MLIDCFKSDLFDKLSIYNDDLESRFKNACFSKNNTWYYKADPQREVSYWFDITNPTNRHFPGYYPLLIDKNFDKKFTIRDYYSNYVTIYIINKLFNDQHNILIEDIGSGPGYTEFYLNKLGYKNFNLIDNFSQFHPDLLDKIMYDIPHMLNNMQADPIVITQCGWPHVVMQPTTSTLLVCIYQRPERLNDKLILDLNLNNFKLIGEDTDHMMYVFCRSDKYDEYTTKLNSF